MEPDTIDVLANLIETAERYYDVTLELQLREAFAEGEDLNYIRVIESRGMLREQEGRRQIAAAELLRAVEAYRATKSA